MCLVTKTDFFKLSLYRPLDVRTFLESLGLLLDLELGGIGILFRPHSDDSSFVVHVASDNESRHVSRHFGTSVTYLRSTVCTS